MTTLIGALALTPGVALAQSPQADVAVDLAALRREVEQLRRELDALRAARPTPAALTPAEKPVSPTAGAADASMSAALDVVKAQVAELAQVKVESASRMPVRIFGVIHTHLFANSGSANWLESPNLVDAPLAGGGGGTFSGTLRQTRLGFTVDGPTLGAARTSGVVAMDFFGGVPGFQTGQVMGLPRLLVAYARIDGARTSLELGQDHVILAPRDPSSLASLSFPLLFRSGNLYLRAPQVRIEQKLGAQLKVVGGIVAPIGGDLSGGDYRFVPPALGGERSMRPGVQARVLFERGDCDSTRFVSVGVSGHYGWERRPVQVDPAQLDRARLDRAWVGAVDFGVRRDRLGLAGEVYVGDNADAFGGALGLARRGAGGWAEVQLFAHPRASFHLGAGRDALRSDDRASLSRRGNSTLFGNVVFTLTPEIQASLEYRRLATRPGTGADRINHHVDWVMTYKF